MRSAHFIAGLSLVFGLSHAQASEADFFMKVECRPLGCAQDAAACIGLTVSGKVAVVRTAGEEDDATGELKVTLLDEQLSPILGGNGVSELKVYGMFSKYRGIERLVLGSKDEPRITAIKLLDGTNAAPGFVKVHNTPYHDVYAANCDFSKFEDAELTRPVKKKKWYWPF